MKKLMITAAALTMLAGTAMAGPTLSGYGEYALEAEQFEVGLSAGWELDSLSVSAGVVGTHSAAESLHFDHAEVGASYSLSDNLSAYGKIKTDSNLKYNELVIGTALSF